MRAKTLLTTFEPFGKRTVNSSQIAARRLPNMDYVDIVDIPVSFKDAHRVVIETIKKGNYDFVLMVGETSATSDSVRIEKVALNFRAGSTINVNCRAVNRRGIYFGL